MGTNFIVLGLIGGVLTSSICCRSAIAQVISDGTNHTTINRSGNNFTILNGIEKGNNLFHSFSNFSVPTGGSARFDLSTTPNITTIFSRVTGGNVSNIDGLIQTLNSNNPVSLFLMNPNGIIFGQNAKLDIGGSFIGTTANSIKFADGTELSTTNLDAPPLLTMSAPIGLQLGQNPGVIQVQGTGSSLSLPPGTSSFSPSPLLGVGQSSTGLRVQPGNTLALIGGGIALDGGVLTAPQGRIELGSGADGVVSLNPTGQGWSLGYAGIQSFGDIHLSQIALLDASGFGGGSIQIQGNNITLRDGSVALIQNQGLTPSGAIALNALLLLS